MTNGRVTISARMHGIECCAQFQQLQASPPLWDVQVYLDGQLQLTLPHDQQLTPGWDVAERLFREQALLFKQSLVDRPSLRLVAAD